MAQNDLALPRWDMVFGDDNSVIRVGHGVQWNQPLSPLNSDDEDQECVDQCTRRYGTKLRCPNPIVTGRLLCDAHL